MRGHVVSNGIARCSVTNRLLTADSRQLPQLGIEPDSVALVVTSPPYFVGKAYETDAADRWIPRTSREYNAMLRDVFAHCWRVLEPGGRIAVNVANVGRKPYRALSSEVIAILQDLGYLLRGEIVWVKPRAAVRGCAWGTFASARNPVLRDVSERVVVASKQQFSRAVTSAERQRLGLPYRDSIGPTDFVRDTIDVWQIAPEHASRVGHPAPFPVELPRRLIELYTYIGDVVLDPFSGSGSTALAAVQTGRRYIGVDLYDEYTAIARRRVAQAVAELATAAVTTWRPAPSR